MKIVVFCVILTKKNVFKSIRYFQYVWRIIDVHIICGKVIVLKCMYINICVQFEYLNHSRM